MLDTKALAEATAAIVREHVAAATVPLLAEIKALKDQVAELGEREVPAPGLPDFSELVAQAVAALPAPKDGEPGRDGKDIDPDALAALVDEAVSRAMDGIEAPELPDIGAIIEEKFAALPAPKDGEPGKDGEGIADLLIDRDGGLVASFTDGRLKELGRVVGRDGKDGQDGAPGVPFGPEDIDMTLMEDGRTVRMAFRKGDVEYAFPIPFPIVLDRGVFAEGKAYEEGDGVTWGGSFWIAQRATQAKPDSPDSGWRLAVKRGRDGKDKS